MRVKIVTRAYDDNGHELKEGDMILIQTKDIPEPALGKIQKIQTKIITCIFDDPIIGYAPKKIRLEDIMTAEYYRQ